jgi:hypothetical protein
VNHSAAEADLISAAANGPAAVYGVLLQKLAELNLDTADRAAVLDRLEEIELQNDRVPTKQAFLSEPVVRALALGTMIAGPAAAGIGAIMDARAKSKGFADLQATAPELMQDPVRGKALYDLLYSSAPTVAQNTPIAADLMRQMSAQPNIDLGTVGRLADIRKSMTGQKSDGGTPVGRLLSGVKDVGTMGQAANVLSSGSFGGKTASVRANHIALDGTPCFFNWGAEPMKTAGLTDAFSGSGTPMEQASNAYDMGQQTQQYPLMPLDAVVRELLAKEQELAQREEVLAQREQMMAQAAGVQGQMSGAYQSEYGVDPTTGLPVADQEQPPEGDAPHGEQPAGGMPPEAMGQPEGEMPPGAEGEMPPEAAGGMPPEAIGQPEGEMPPGAEGEMPPEAAGEMPPGAEGEVPPEAMGQPEGEMPPEATGETSPEATGEMPPGAEGELPPEATGEMPPEAAGGMPPAAPGEAIEGSVEDELDHHTGPGALPEGSPEDQAADDALAQQMAASGQTPTPLPAAAPASAGAPSMLPAAPPTAVPDGMGGMSVTIPLPSIQLTMKLAELDRQRDAILANAFNIFKG